LEYLTGWVAAFVIGDKKRTGRSEPEKKKSKDKVKRKKKK